MCGIAGFLGYGELRAEAVHDIASRMGVAIRHRGPDDSGVWRDDAAQVALVHRRLSILDLSPAGHQPMVSASGRYVMVFNGEIYNHAELRAVLDQAGAGGSAGMRWRGHSDTETLLAGIDAWGLEETLRRAVGMFALALWDRQARSLCLARDRLGEKPLYYGWQQGVFLFGSELKALRAHPAFVGEIDRDAMTLQLRHGYIPAPHSIYRGIGKLPPGHWLRLRAGAAASSDAPMTAGADARPFWSLAEVVARGRTDRFTGTDAEAVAVLDGLLRDSVARRMVADVPLGAFLSGGVDSSTVVALMQSQSTRPVKTFTIGFEEAGYNEAEYAKAVARHLGTEHTELYVAPRQALDVIPRLPALYDEPFSDSSQIPTFLVSQLARRHVTVSLTGDAGDELFGGYDRYTMVARHWRHLSPLPHGFRRWLARLLRSLPAERWNGLLGFAQPLLPAGWRHANLGDRLHGGAGVLTCNGLAAFYLGCVTHWKNPASLVSGATEPVASPGHADSWAGTLHDIESMMFTDLLAYLPDDILCKVDRASMGVSLETRVPLLDHWVVEFAWRLPMRLKIRNGQGKWILRQVLDRYVPKALIERAKMGFGVPIDSWLRGPLRDWAESLLDESRLRREGFFDPAPIRRNWAEHLAGVRNRHYQLWDVLMFQAWLEHRCRSAPRGGFDAVGPASRQSARERAPVV